ncbi:MAG TPA: SDR family NAD(P)-dependent oxidoreductase [Kofleriaceae bacterium]|jgi:NADP-dependent 3-hydroxy acid dehydrogenase YdfG
MSKTIIVAGFGPGISNAVAKKFGREGFQVALVARSADTLAAGVKELEEAGIKAKAFPADLGTHAEVTAVVKKIHGDLGPITAILWNAYSRDAADMLTASPDEISSAVNLAVTSLSAAIQAALPDLRAQKGSVLVTNGGFGITNDMMDGLAAKFAMGLSIANAAKHKLVGVFNKKLAPDVFVGEVMVMGSVKGTAFDDGTATIDPASIADKFWALHTARTDVFATS